METYEVFLFRESLAAYAAGYNTRSSPYLEQSACHHVVPSLLLAPGDAQDHRGVLQQTSPQWGQKASLLHSARG
jgi:hypothetical protein